MRRRRQSKYGTAADHPVLAAQFDLERNGRTPNHVNAGTSEKLWWACPVADDHRWQAIGASLH